MTLHNRLIIKPDPDIVSASPAASRPVATESKLPSLMMRIGRAFLLIAAFLTAYVVQPQICVAVIVIDDFSTSSLGGSTSSGEIQSNDFTGLAGVLGGTRKASILFNGNSNESPLTALVAFGVDGVSDPESDTLHFVGSGGPVATGIAKMVLDGSNFPYEGIRVADPFADIDFDGLGSLDLTEGGTQTGFVFDVEAVSASTNLTVTLYDASLNDGTRTSHTFSISSTGIAPVPFSNFDASILADTGTIALTVDMPNNGTTFRMESWQTAVAVIPVPAALPLFGSGLMGLAWAARRRLGKVSGHKDPGDREV